MNSAQSLPDDFCDNGNNRGKEGRNKWSCAQVLVELEDQVHSHTFKTSIGDGLSVSPATTSMALA